MMRSTTPILALRLLLLLVLCAGAAGDGHAKPRVRTYTVQPGDSIWSIAAEFYGSGDKYKIIYKHNTFIGKAPPYILKPGQVLTLPEGTVSPEAQVDWRKKEVKAKPPRSLDWIEAGNKMNLWEQYQVQTGDESAVHIVFEDASDLSLADNTLIVIYGGTSRTAKTRARTKTQVLLKEGTIRGGLGALDKKPAPPPGGQQQAAPEERLEPMQIETPSGMLDIYSTDVQVQCDDGATAVSVYDGEVDVKAGGTLVKVPKDHGTVVMKGEKPEAPRALPPPPAWNIAGEGSAVAIVPFGGRATVEAAWSPVSAAHTYRIELAHDERFKKVAVSLEVDAGTTRLVLDDVPVGRFWARVSAKDVRKLQGRPSRTLMIDVVGVDSSRRMTKAGGRWEVVGFTRLDLGKLGAAPAPVPPAKRGKRNAPAPVDEVDVLKAADLEWALDDGEFTSGTEPQRVMTEGAHTIKVRRVNESVTTTFSFHVLAVRGVLDLGVPGERLHAGGDAREVALTVTDEKGRPVSVPDVKIETDLGASLPLTIAGAGHWKATLPAPEPPGPRQLVVRASWADGLLDAGRIDVERKLLEPYVYQWREAVPGLAWDGRKAATPLPSITPIDRVGSEMMFGRRGDETVGSLALVGEIGLLPEPVEGLPRATRPTFAIDGALTLFRLQLDDADVHQGNELGDAVLGLRYLALRDKRLTLAPSFRARLPLGPEDGVGVGLEPSLLVRLRVLEKLWVDTRQGVFSALGSAGDHSYIGDYALLYMPFGIGGILGVSLQLDTAVSLSDGDENPAAVALGAGAQLHLGRVRLGFELGYGLTDGGHRRFGDVVGGLTLDFGFGTP